MKKYWRWIVFGVVAIGIIALLLFIGANKDLRQRLTALLLERKVKTEIQNTRDKAAAAKAKADTNQISAEEAADVAKQSEEAIAKQKTALQQGLKARGLNAGEIANRFTSLGV